MPEPIPCPNCGAFHAPGECATMAKVDATQSTNESALLPEQQQAIVRIQESLKHGLIDEILSIKDEFNIPDAALRTPEIQAAAVEGMMVLIRKGSLENALETKEYFHITDEIFQLPEVQAAVIGQLIKRLKEGGVDYVIKIRKKFHIPDAALQLPEMQDAVVQGLHASLRNASMGRVHDIKESFSLPESVLRSPEIKAAAVEGIMKMLKEGNLVVAKKMQIEFQIPDESFQLPEVQTAAATGMATWIFLDNIGKATAFKDILRLSETTVQSAALEAMVRILRDGNIPHGGDNVSRAFNVKEQFHVSDDIAQAAIVGLLMELLRAGEGDYPIRINEVFKISDTKIISSLCADMHELVEQLRTAVPVLYTQVQSRLDLTVALYAYREKPEQLLKELDAHPFLTSALTENPRYGSKLVLKYPGFDPVAQEKVAFLFESKKNVLTAEPDLDPESHAFRLAMQEKLRGYGRNAKIITAMQEAGVNTERFLNYENTREFMLRSGDTVVPLSERLRAPYDRMGETIHQYVHTVKRVLSEYRQDLIALMVEPPELEQFRADIVAMEQRIVDARAAGDEKKAAGMTRGLEGLRGKLANAKPMPLWDRIMNDLQGFAKLEGALEEARGAVIATEEKLNDLMSAKQPSGIELLALKGELSKKKEEFLLTLQKFERRVLGFREGLEGQLATLGKDRATALVQEINEQVAEQMSHFETDRKTLANMFSERGDKEREKLEDRTMSMFVWARNPDVDLYQGNYTSCCVSIEGDIHGATSPIADYATDLGIQVVNIWDDAKKMPVIAAWCWVGKDQQGRAALVVDNVEANTLYSSNFSAELSKELLDYLKEYARAIGVDRLVMGKANNDLPGATEFSQLPEAEALYEKIGGENGRPNGYYFEAEEETVKLLWEKVQRVTLVSKEEKMDRRSVELRDLEFRGVELADVDAILTLEREVYPENLVSGRAMINEFESRNGHAYSVTLSGKVARETTDRLIGYALAYEGETDEGVSSVYLEDIAISPDVQGQGVGWKLVEDVIRRIKARLGQGGPKYFDMHLRENSVRLFETHRTDLEQMGVRIAESVLVPNYYDEGEDAVYQVYEVGV